MRPPRAAPNRDCEGCEGVAKILFLAHRAPFPPDKGDRIRAYHILRHLAARHEVWLGASADDPQTPPLPDGLCRAACIAPHGPVRRALNMAAGALTGAPLSVARFRHPVLEQWIQRVLRDEQPDVVFIYSSALAQYVVGKAPPGTKLIVDFVDADAEKWRAYGAQASPPMRWVYRAEFRRLVAFDRRTASVATAALFVSETERRLFARFAPEAASKLHVVANGVDVDYFKPAAGPIEAANIVLCGRMDYWPNVDGAAWFANEVLPRVRQVRPDATFRIVGAAPTPTILALAALPGVEVTGAVPDVRPYLARAAVVVAPLRIARGIQNKVLEGMAAGKIVVATPAAMEGIGATPGRDALVAGDAAAFAEAVTDAIEGRRPTLGANARRYVVAHHRWESHLAALDRLVAEGCSAEAAA